MTATPLPVPDEAPLPAFGLPARSDHPVLSAVLDELRLRALDPEPVVARYEDAP
ncbi:hypothetical protein ABII15_25915 [Streptomyces sp. HUAS MG91]|uniref:Uncharacterized protein n=1 Tax=Streptomyces tabacisoli TaxID=3156398 RepID=A0AAU8IZQ8_9ACTN